MSIFLSNNDIGSIDANLKWSHEFQLGPTTCRYQDLFVETFEFQSFMF